MAGVGEGADSCCPGVDFVREPGITELTIADEATQVAVASNNREVGVPRLIDNGGSLCNLGGGNDEDALGGLRIITIFGALNGESLEEVTKESDGAASGSIVGIPAVEGDGGELSFK
jgi:hypothetical protein